MKRILSCFLAVVLLASMLPVSVLADTVKNPPSLFAGGDGTEQNPYLVSTAEQLNAVRQDLSAHYFQINDIDLSGFDNWVPIGTLCSLMAMWDYQPAEPQPFTGSYNGGNHLITGLRIHDEDASIDSDCIGLFGGTKDAKLTNIHLQDVDIYAFRGDDDYEMINQNCGRAALYIGGICGKGENTVFEDCTVSGDIAVSQGCTTFAGGIVGESTGSLSRCENHARLDIHANRPTSYYENSDATVGGIVGSMKGEVEICANSGEIRGVAGSDGKVGGIVGIIAATNAFNSSITNCANYAPISYEIDLTVYSQWYSGVAGGIAGYVSAQNEVAYTYHDAYFEASSCINYGNVRAQGKSAAGRVTVGGVFGSVTVGYLNSRADATCLMNLAANLYTLTVTNDNEIKYVDGQIGRICPFGSRMSFMGCGSLNSTLINDMPYTGPENGLETNGEYSAIQGVNRTAQELLQESGYFFQSYYDSWSFDFEKYWVIHPEAGGAVLRDIEYTIIKPPAAPTTYVEALYRADQLINGTVGIQQFPALNVWLTTNGHSPSKALLDAMGDGMAYNAEAWEKLTTFMDAVTEGPGVLIANTTKERDMITAILMESMREQTKLNADNSMKDIGKTTIEVTDAIASAFEAAHLTGKEFQDFAKTHKEDLLAVFDDYFEEKRPFLSDFLETADAMQLLGTVAEMVDNTSQMVERYATYIELVSLNAQTKAALEAMLVACPSENREMLAALSYMTTVMDAANEEILEALIKGDLCVCASLNNIGVLVDAMWGYAYDTLSILYPQAAVIAAAYKAEKLLLEAGFGVEARVEQYYKMGVIVQLEAVANTAMRDALMDYQETPNLRNAEKMLGLVDMKFALLRCDYREAIRFSELTFDKALADKLLLALESIFTDAEPQNTLKKQLEERQRLANNLYYMVCTSWLHALENDHPALVPRYEIYRAKMKALYYTDSLSQVPETPEPEVAKKLTVQCPVNVYIYNNAGDLVASVVDGVVNGNDQISLVYDHGEKVIFFHNFRDYTVVCEGFDQGTMDLLLTEYFGSDVFCIGYNQLPVRTGESYTLTMGNPEDIQLLDPQQTMVTPNMHSSFAGQKYPVLTVENGYLSQSGGLFRHEGQVGEKVSVTAIVPEGYQFLGWIVTKGQAIIKDETALSTEVYLSDSDATVKARIKKQSDKSPSDDSNKDNDASPDSPIWGIVALAVILVIAGVAVTVIVIKKRKQKKQ